MATVEVERKIKFDLIACNYSHWSNIFHNNIQKTTLQLIYKEHASTDNCSSNIG
jgi:hypothetical protein